MNFIIKKQIFIANNNFSYAAMTGIPPDQTRKINPEQCDLAIHIWQQLKTGCLKNIRQPVQMGFPHMCRFGRYPLEP